MNTAVLYLIMFAMPLIAVAKVVIQGKVTKGFIETTEQLMLFNAVQFFIAAAANTALNVRSFPPDFLFLILAALGTSVFTMLTQTCYTAALKEGPVGKTCIIFNFAAFIPLAAGVVFFNEALNINKILALICMAVAFILIPRNGKEPINRKWLLLAAGAMVSNGMANVILLFVGKTPALNSNKDLYFTFIFLFASAISLCIYAVLHKIKPTAAIGKMLGTPKFLYGAAAIGVLICVYNYCTPLVLSGVDSTVFYPVTNLGVMVISALAGIVLFKEKISLKSGIGIVIALISILLTNI